MSLCCWMNKRPLGCMLPSGSSLSSTRSPPGTQCEWSHRPPACRSLCLVTAISLCSIGCMHTLHVAVLPLSCSLIIHVQGWRCSAELMFRCEWKRRTWGFGGAMAAMMSSFSAAAGGASAMAARKGDAWDCELGTSALEVPGARCLGLWAWPPPPRLPSTPNGAAVWEPTRHTDTQTHRHT